jgi:hypothetical protein
MKNAGYGRIAYLNRPTKLGDIIETVKYHFDMKTFRLALGKFINNFYYFLKMIFNI